ncbi:MAG: nitroreductase family protein [Clostridiales bacterium]|nr:nitroreductase family protein [Clostridiales bacterium]
MDGNSIIFKRRSIRKYKEESVDKDILIHLVEAGMAAPTACNNKPWEFIVITENMDSLRKNLYFGNYNAPAAIVVCGNMKLAKGGIQKYWVQDCSAAMENILLAATEKGLGSVWIGLYPQASAIKPVSDYLDLPDYVVPLGIALVGYSDEDKDARTQYNEKRVYWESYDKNRKHRSREKNMKFL